MREAREPRDDRTCSTRCRNHPRKEAQNEFTSAHESATHYRAAARHRCDVTRWSFDLPITGGSFEGDRLRGKVLPGGDDWMLLRADGVRELDLRITLETDDGALIYMTFTGLRHGAATDAGGEYFRTLPRFETAAPKYAFLNKLLAVGVGEFRADGPVHLIEEIL